MVRDQVNRSKFRFARDTLNSYRICTQESREGAVMLKGNFGEAGAKKVRNPGLDPKILVRYLRGRQPASTCSRSIRLTAPLDPGAN